MTGLSARFLKFGFAGVLAVAAGLAACQENPAVAPQVETDAGLSSVPVDADAGTPDAQAVVDAGPPRLNVEARALEPDGGVTNLAPQAPEQLVAPGSRFEVELDPMRDVRVRLFDADDRVVSSNDRIEHGTRSRFVLAPVDPLPPGSRFVLAIDGMKFDEPRDPSGRAFQPFRLPFKTSGTRPEPPPAPSGSKSGKPKSKAKKR